MSLPIYQEDGATYRADSCRPLEEAVSARQVRLESLVHGHYPGRRLPRNLLNGVKTVGYWDADQPQAWGLDWHCNEGLELTFLERGTMSFAVDGHAWGLRPNDLTLTRPWQRHRVGDPNVAAGRLHFLILDVGVRRPHQDWRWPPWMVMTRADLAELTEMLRHNEQPVWHAGADVCQCLRRIALAVEADRQGSQVSRLTVHLNELFVLVLDLLRQARVALDASLSSSLRTVELFWNDLREHPDYLGLEWTVTAMARRCGLGLTHFIHHSKQLHNMTPAQYLNCCRLQHAATLLDQRPDLGVTQVAMECGFSSGQYFATQFHRHFGSTPRDYRRRAQAENEA